MNFYNEVFAEVVKTYPQRSNAYHAEQAKSIYSNIKTVPDSEKVVRFQAEMQKLKTTSAKRKAESLLYYIHAGEKIAERNSKKTITSETPAASESSTSAASLNIEENNNGKEIKKDRLPIKKTNPPRAQIEAREALMDANERLSDMQALRPEDDPEVQKATIVRNLARKALQQKISNANRQRSFQANRRQKLKVACEQDDALKAALHIKNSSGRPNSNEIQPGLLKTKHLHRDQN